MPVERTPLSNSDLVHISQLKAAGHGWAKYAVSVEKQGWCSEKQRDTLVSMAHKVKPYIYTSGRGEYDMDMDEYIELGYEGHPGQYDGEGFW